jgi:hypothetical protein
MHQYGIKLSRLRIERASPGSDQFPRPVVMRFRSSRRRERMPFCCVTRAAPEARGRFPNASRKREGIVSHIGWIAGIGLIMGTQAWATDRAQLDRCQAQLAACYETCKSQGVAPKTCSERCTTDQCGLPWREPYGAFLDRRIEENAAPVSTAFVGLRRIKGARRAN